MYIDGDLKVLQIYFYAWLSCIWHCKHWNCRYKILAGAGNVFIPTENELYAILQFHCNLKHLTL